jgi:hypothetical protein
VQPFVDRSLDRLLRATRDTDVTASAWLQGFGLSPSHEHEAEEVVEAMRQRNIDDIWVWAFESAGHMTSLATDDPPAVWDYVCRILQR